MTACTFSIITPVFKGEETLPATAHSVLSQSDPSFEWIIVADDERLPVYQTMPALQDPRIRFSTTRRAGAGPSVARNVGLDIAQGTYVVPLDADDVMHPQRLELLLPLLRKFGAALDRHQVMDITTGVLTGHCVGATAAPWLTLQDACALNMPVFPVFLRNLGMRWNEQLRFAEDVVLLLEIILANGNIALLPEPLLTYHLRPTSICNQMPQGYFNARDGYLGILQELAAGSLASLPAIVHAQLQQTIQRKHTLNEEFWRAYSAGSVRNFGEFAASI